MKRIVIIGNGLDIAHGLETRYLDFVSYYLKKFLKKLIKDGLCVMDNPFFILKINASNRLLFQGNPKGNGVIDELFSSQNIMKHGIEALMQENNIEFKYKDNLNLLKFTLDENNKDWGNIENSFIKMMDKIIDDSKELTIELNYQLEILKDELFEYLKDYVEPKIDENTKINELEEIIFSDPEIVNEIIFINFNYTSTLKYLIKTRMNPYQQFFTTGNRIVNVNYNIKFYHIHGSIEKGKKSIIFGYGNENHRSYDKFKLIHPQVSLKNFKTVWYNKYSEYQDVLKQIKSGEYEVFCFGHSFSSTDKTLLKTIFSNKNCLRVKNFYKKNIDDYSRNFIDILLILDNDEMAREKIVNFENSSSCPQLNKS